ncbi:trehalose operon repressor [Lactococcus formosensis]|uniref:Trehalose operon repressor n=1 Tax=Lactococcus formosensis TaxID=1281486 RepID=A0A9X4P782_9LACT|nr:trehalose operon repressor [Lactococcus formosensis]NHI68052.1 trehalose operon repressor [Lactococcus garvieae]MCH1722097.1 trehalose operon repressor [Lactococcus formosensis]MCO7180087.1 trehalose operon repressor [Lactococcus formosensis]MDG6113822.1 trehalose operon repressor [Lactococcus formosensis]MDG6115803.1 trehalose operon repressor [Lactococcus formosensis]
MKKYEIILRDLEKKIHEGRYPENELLPSENQLTVLYQTSRATVRQALKILEENGIIQRRHGFGSIVIPRERLMFPISGLTSFKELKDSLNFSSTTEILIFEKITVDKELSELSFFEEGTQAFHILRRRNIDEQFVILDRDYILASTAPNMTREKVKSSLYSYLEDQVNLDISYAQKEITIDFANDEDKTYLDLNPKDRHVVSVRSHVYLTNNNVFQYTESRHQVDKFRFTEFSRRQKH